MHPQTLKPFGGEYFFNYRLDIFKNWVVFIDSAWFVCDYLVGSFLCNIVLIATNFSVILKIYLGYFMVKPHINVFITI